MLITSFDHLARQSHGKELYGKSGLYQSTASFCGWQFRGSFELEIGCLFFLVIPFMCSTSMRRSRMTICFLHVNGHPVCGERLSPGYGMAGTWRLCIVLCVVWGLGKVILKLVCEEFPWVSVSTLYGKKGTNRYLKESAWGLIESSGDFKSYSTRYSTSMSRTIPVWMLAKFIFLLLRGLQLMAFVCFSVRWWFSYVSTANCVSYWIFFWLVFFLVGYLWHLLDPGFLS